MELRERKQNDESLKEKIKWQWQNRDFSPKKEQTSQFALYYFFTMFVLSLIESLFVLIPTAYQRHHRWIMAGSFVWVMFITLVNWHRSYFDTANYVKAETKQKYFADCTETPQDWVHCFKCQVDRPPRAFHCDYCGKCMLKRAHHCFVTSSCIGFYNQKYFIMFSLWSVIASSWLVYLQLLYLNIVLPVSEASFIVYLPPVTLFKLIMGNITFGQAFVVAHLFMNIPMIITGGFFLFWHSLLSVEGATNYEAKQRKFPYKGTVNQNLKSVFGSVFYIPLLVLYPFRLEQDGDGILWKSRAKRVKGN